ncbi:YihY/virulence factor BrkB family protein [Sphingomonas alba]|uniref:YihY/virulence factor BrkB family protein n=1 Tax=Sphingomonas alba TaxID=2908208 RepID=A0ABT0RQA5_9SPHN|nr:YihY/virulence factor BrkB family protein [Sphingomonas alba]
MQERHPLSPEARRKKQAAETAAYGQAVTDKIHKPATAWDITKRVLIGVYNDGFIHAGNLAYLALLALFPFFITAAAIAQLLGQSADSQLAVASVLGKLPPDVASALRGPIQEVLTLRTGPLLWFGAIVGLWTAGSFVETIRDILRRAYGVEFCAPFWTYRLGSIGLIIAAVLLLMAAFGLTVLLSSVHHFVVTILPLTNGLATDIGLYRLAPAVAIYVTFYFLFLALTPSRYRKIGCRKWPGALLVTAWWVATSELLPNAIGLFGGYSLTYGSLAGVMVVLLFFFVIGLGVVMGAELNAALADSGGHALKGEIYSGPFVEDLEVDEPEPGEDVVPKVRRVRA